MPKSLSNQKYAHKKQGAEKYAYYKMPYANMTINLLIWLTQPSSQLPVAGEK